MVISKRTDPDNRRRCPMNPQRHIGELGMTRAADGEVAKLAQRQGRVVVTLDSGLSRLVALGDTAVSIAPLRPPRVSRESVVALLKRLLPYVDDDLHGDRGELAHVRVINAVRVASAALWDSLWKYSDTIIMLRLPPPV